MLLIAGGTEDPNTERVVDHAHIREIPYIFFETDGANPLAISWDFESQELVLNGQALTPEAAFIRWDVFGGEQNNNQIAYDCLYGYALSHPNMRLLNRYAGHGGNDKSYNLWLAKQLGFPVPRGFVTCDIARLRKVSEADRAAMIVKPLHGGEHTQSLKTFLERDSENQLDRPIFAQEFLAGENLRCFVIGGKVFAFHLQSEAIDYRDDAGVQVHSIAIPAGLEPLCQSLASRLKFDYCALDFRCRAGFEDPVFLEINSFPMFVAFDNACDNQLADAILKTLMPTS